MTIADSSNFTAKLNTDRFLITSEITPPVSFDPQALRDKVLPLAGIVDAVNVTDGASARAAMDPLAASPVETGIGLRCKVR
jgi:methylenetetrahydrofolate reductase (NADPH)